MRNWNKLQRKSKSVLQSRWMSDDYKLEAIGLISRMNAEELEAMAKAIAKHKPGAKLVNLATMGLEPRLR
jgi:hypothetical protein